jgi:hypothetical protein
MDSQAPDSSSFQDTGTQETSTLDTGIAETSLDGTQVSDGPAEGAAEGGEMDSGEDSGHAEAGSDGGHEDGGQTEAGSDGGHAEAGEDSGTVDSGSDAQPTEAGSDGGEEGGADASEAGAQDTGSDAPTYSFADPLQVDVSSILNVNTIVSSVSGGIGLTPIDGAGAATGYDFPTLAGAMKLVDAGASGFPNNGFFATNGTTVPNVQLAWNDDGVHPISKSNSIRLAGNAGTAVAFNVPQAKYTQVQIYATGGNGAGSLSTTLTYATGNPVTTTAIPLPDWCGAPGPTGEYQLGTQVARVQNGTTYAPNPPCGIFAIDLGPDSTRELTNVSITDTGAANSYFAFYGATAW